MPETPEWPVTLLCRWCVQEISDAQPVSRANLKPDHEAYRITDTAQSLRTAALGFADPYVSTNSRPLVDPRAVTMIGGSAVCGERWHLTQALEASRA